MGAKSPVLPTGVSSRVRQELDCVLSGAFEEVWQMASERDISPRTAAYVLGIDRVRRAIELGGIR